MSVDQSAHAIAAILDQVYRGGAEGVPNRFYLGSIEGRDHELRRYARRTRALRPEFFNQAGEELECEFEILMSQPRDPKGGVLAFASLNIFERWPQISTTTLQTVIDEISEPDWLERTRKRVQRLYELNHGISLPRLKPVVLSTAQLCTLADKEEFDYEWWNAIVSYPSGASRTRLVFFYSQIGADRVAITRVDYVLETFYHPTDEDWSAAVKRAQLIEYDEDASDTSFSP